MAHGFRHVPERREALPPAQSRPWYYADKEVFYGTYVTPHKFIPFTTSTEGA